MLAYERAQFLGRPNFIKRLINGVYVGSIYSPCGQVERYLSRSDETFFGSSSRTYSLGSGDQWRRHVQRRVGDGSR
jgi:hypothetical protein